MKSKIYEDLAGLYPLWRQTTLQKTDRQKLETKFVIDVFKKYSVPIHTVVDLGGGVGLHASLLLKAGYDVTVFDQSLKALSLAKKQNPKLKTIHGWFEKINIRKKYDAAICLWSTLSYIFTEKGRKNFYSWLDKHIKKLVILDEANFYSYPKKFHKVYLGEDARYKMKIIRNWLMAKKDFKKSMSIYEIFDKKLNKTAVVKDGENQQYVAAQKLQNYFETDWHSQMFGGYSLKKPYNIKSSRIILVFHKKSL